MSARFRVVCVTSKSGILPIAGLLVLLVLLSGSSSCDKDEPEEVTDPVGTSPASLQDTSGAGATDLIATDMATDMAPVPEEPIESKISRVIEQAKQTKTEYAAFRERMFDEAFSQIKTVLCSSYRLQLLRGGQRDFYKKDPDVYLGRIRDVLDRQGSQPFIQLIRDKQKQPSYGNLLGEEIFVSIPKSEAYSMRKLPLTNLTYERKRALAYDSVNTEWDWQDQDVLQQGVWRFDPVEACEQSYKEPVPNSAIARDESSESMGALIASSLQNLRGYSAKLELVEREWTRANDLELLLLNLQQSLEFNEIDPTARNHVRGYEQELSAALAELGKAKTEGRIEATTVSREEVKAILRLFR